MQGWFKTHDGLKIRYGIWKPEGRPRASVVILGGRGEFLEKYNETIIELLDREMMVFSFDWRGQGLSSRMTSPASVGHVDSFEDYLADLHDFMLNIAGPSKSGQLIMLAHSMGGHIALRYLADRQGIFDKAVLTSPMIQIHASGFSADLMYTVADLATGLGFGRAPIPFTSGRNDYLGDFENNQLTGSRRRFERNRRLLEANPGLLIDAVSFGWLKAAFDSMNVIKRPGFAAKITLPLLMLAAGSDKVVSSRATKKLAAVLPDVSFSILEGSRHEILQETDPIRARFWQLFDSFAAVPACFADN